MRAVNDITELPSWPFHRVQDDGTLPAGFSIKGRYLEIRTTLLRDFCPGATCAGPELKAFYVESGAPGGTLTITAHPKSQVVNAGGNVTFGPVVAPGAIGYQWFKNGSTQPLAVGGKITRADNELHIGNVDCTDAGLYYVRVHNFYLPGTLQSAPARLHVKGNAPVLNLVSGDLPIERRVNLDAPTEIRAHATVSGTGDCNKPHYQWRHNQSPIPNASGWCTDDGNNGWLALLTLDNVQREDAGNYSVVFWNEYGSILSSTERTEATELIVNGTWPVEITQQVTPNGGIVLVLSTSFDAACVQWVKFDELLGDWIPLSNNNPDPMKYVIEPVGCPDQGYYSVIVYDSSGRSYPPPDDVNSPAMVTVSVDGCQ